MRELIRKHNISFRNAFSGIKWAFTTQPNFRIHLLLTFIVIIAGILINLSAVDWVIIIFTIFWALAAEMINTAIESVCDLVTRDWRQEVKIAKDVSAGMMLTVAIGSVFVAIFIFIPKLLLLIK